MAWVALSVHFNDINSPPRMIGEAIIPAILWFMIAAEGLASRPQSKHYRPHRAARVGCGHPKAPAIGTGQEGKTRPAPPRWQFRGLRIDD
jgi:hypothetical protein